MDDPRECHTEWSKSDREGEILYDNPYKYNLRRNDNKLTYKTERHSQTSRRSLWLWVGGGWGEGKIREFGMSMHTMLCLKLITSKDLLHSTRNSAQCYVAAWIGVGSGREWIHVYDWLSPFTVHLKISLQFSLVQFSRSVVSDSLWLHRLQHARLPCPSPTPRAYSNSCPSSPWCHPTISYLVVPFSSHLQSFPALGSFPMNQFFASGGQSIGISALAWILPMNIQDWFPLGCTGWISL